MKSNKNDKNKITELVQYMIAVIVLLVLVFSVVMAYQATNDSRNENNQSRTELSYVANKIHSYDETGNVQIVDGKYGDTLVLIDNTDDGNYETRIYSYKGSLYEEYASAESEMNYEIAMEIAKSDTFQVSQTDGLIEIKTDEGQLLVALRTEE